MESTTEYKYALNPIIKLLSKFNSDFFSTTFTGPLYRNATVHVTWSPRSPLISNNFQLLLKIKEKEGF